MMSKHKRSRFHYHVDLEHESGMWGVGSIKCFQDRDVAMSYVEELADSNREMVVSVTVVPSQRAKWPRKAR